MKKAQFGISFQWIYVVLAGGAFLIMFLFLVRGCSQQSEQQIQGAGVVSAARQLDAMTWQGKTRRNITVQPAETVCSGTLTLQADDASATLDHVPAFLSPELSGALLVETVPVELGAESASPLSLGSALYGFDSSTYYLVVRDPLGRQRDIIALLPERNVRVIEPGDVSLPDRLRLPETARTGIIVTTSGVDLRNAILPDEPARYLGIAVQPQAAVGGIVRYYGREGASLDESDVVAYDGQDMLRGALAAAQEETYECAKDNFIRRARYLTLIYQNRTQELLGKSSCDAVLQRAHDDLADINGKEDDAYLASLFSSRLVMHQVSLLDRGCPVIG